MAIKFNRAQLKNPTPASVSFKINVVMAICSIVGGWVGTASFIPAKPSTIIQSVLSLIVLIGIGIKPFFGIQPTSETVPAEDVKEVEDKPEEKPDDKQP